MKDAYVDAFIGVLAIILSFVFDVPSAAWFGLAVLYLAAHEYRGHDK